MPTTTNEEIIHRLIQEYVNGNMDIFDELLLTEFFDYDPRPGELTAPQAFRQVGQDLKSAMPDLHLTLADMHTEGDLVRGQVTFCGTYTQPLWGAPGTGRQHTMAADFNARFQNGRCAITLSGMNLIEILRDMEIAPPPEKAHLKPKYTVSIPEILIRLAFNGLRLQEKSCSHLDQIVVIEPSTNVCEQCLESGDEWPGLRMCLVCGFTGCCDTSKNKHMKRHCEETGHPIIRSVQPGEGWIWCYEDSAMLSSWHLENR
jgi:predicted ester cyclase